MTRRKRANRKKRRAGRGAVLLCACAVGFALLLFLRPAAALEYSRRGLQLCSRSVIPSLFPFMVLSGLIVSSGCAGAAGRFLDRPARALFGVGGSGAVGILLGLLCGFPVGAVNTAALVRRGELGREEAARVLPVCCYPSPAFLITTVGASLFGSRRLGLVTALSVWGAGVICGIAGKYWIRGGAELPPASAPPPVRVTAETLTGAVSGAAGAMVNVCAFVVFFSCVSGCAGEFLPPTAGAAVSGFFELSSGVSAAAALPDPRLAVVMAAAAAGWSGVSVHLQVASAVGGEIPLRPYLASKAAQAALAGGICFALLLLFPRRAAQAAALGGVFGGAEEVFRLPRAWVVFADSAFVLSLPTRPSRLPRRSAAQRRSPENTRNFRETGE